MRARLIGFAAVLAALGAVCLPVWLGASSPGAPVLASTAGVVNEGSTPVTAAEFACPPAARLALAAVPAARATGGSLSLAPIGQAPNGNQPTAPSRQALLLNPTSPTAATALQASGAMAQGLTAEVAGPAGISVFRCAQPGSDAWFAGTGEAAGATGVELYLMNLDEIPATVNITLITDSGLIQNTPYDGITVPPGQTLTVPLTAALHGADVVALNVHASAGRVASAVWESASNGGVWLPPTAAPTTHQVVTGLAAASSAARLFVVVPGNQNAQVKIVALTPQGRFLPFGPGPLSAPSNAASEFTLSSLGAGAAGIELISNVPVTAAIAVPGSGLGAVTPAATPVAQQAVVAGNPSSGYAVSVVLSAPQATARVSLSALPGVATTVTVPSGHSLAVTVRAPPGAGRTFAVLLTPLNGSGPVYAARLVATSGTSGTIVSDVPMVSAPVSVALAPVRQSYDAVMP